MRSTACWPELYSNALEHGVLGLDSSLKRDASGLPAIINSAMHGLDELQDGYVRVHLQSGADKARVVAWRFASRTAARV